MTRGARTDGEVQHLTGKDEDGYQARQGGGAIVQLAASLAQRHGDDAGSKHSGADGCLGIEEAVRNVYAITSAVDLVANG